MDLARQAHAPFKPLSLTTERLLMRRWLPRDREPFASICADPEVMRYFPALLSKEETFALIERIERHFDEKGFGLWALERKEDRRFLGFVGLSTVRVECAIAGEIEIGWRLGREFWGRGLASEGARAALDFAFQTVELPRLVSMTTTVNERSRKLMERLGLKRAPELDFDHPRMGERLDLKRHIVFALSRTSYLTGLDRLIERR